MITKVFPKEMFNGFLNIFSALELNSTEEESKNKIREFTKIFFEDSEINEDSIKINFQEEDYDSICYVIFSFATMSIKEFREDNFKDFFSMLYKKTSKEHNKD